MALDRCARGVRRSRRRAIDQEIFDAGELALFAVSRRVTDGADGDSWYWFEGNRDEAAFNGEGESVCVNCHRRAQRDFVFTVVTD